jgi:hypothetical protein
MDSTPTLRDLILRVCSILKNSRKKEIDPHLCHLGAGFGPAGVNLAYPPPCLFAWSQSLGPCLTTHESSPTHPLSSHCLNALEARSRVGVAFTFPDFPGVTSGLGERRWVCKGHSMDSCPSPDSSMYHPLTWLPASLPWTIHR